MKGQSWFNENSDEGIRNNVIDESRMNSSLGACSWSKGDAKQCDQEEAGILIAGIVLSSARILAGIADILRFLRILGEGFRFSCLYRCQDALNVYTKLPPWHYNTRWVLSQVGKAYFELVDYFEADRAFGLAHQTFPHSLDGMDVYSTVLFHLNEDRKLSYLAQELIATGRLAPQSWIAMGNCYCLQKDHETALKNFHHVYDKAMLHFELALDMKPPATDVANIMVDKIFTLTHFCSPGGKAAPPQRGIKRLFVVRGKNKVYVNDPAWPFGVG